jgi:hypothetical protein
MRRSHLRFAGLSALLVSVIAVILGVSVLAQGAAPKPAAVVGEAALQKLLPAPSGWTRLRTNQDRITLSETCIYSYADAVYTKDAMKVRITLADTAADPSSLAVLATMLTASDYSGFIPPATTIKRFKFNESPAALRWDDQAKEGEFVTVISERFVAKAEGTTLDASDTLQALVEQVNLKALAALR